MKLEEIRTIAGARNIKVGKMKKAEVIREIQNSEGNEPCFDTGYAENCGQGGCLWRGDCA